MSIRVNKNFYQSSPIKVEEDHPGPLKVIEKQGIVSILGSDCERTKAAASLRRTLSADMSSKKWLAKNGFCPMKKIASSEELAISGSTAAADHLPSSSSSSEEEYEGKDHHHERRRPGQDDPWRSIQSQKEKNELDKPHVWTWGSILTQKTAEDTSNLPPAYVHPLVKRSASSLSEKSLEICTESLGSETGSDDFSSYSPSEVGDVEGEKEDGEQQEQEQQQQSGHESFDELQFLKYNYSPGRKMQPRSFPPPLPTLARGGDGASLHMHCHRQNGRLVLEAVSVPSQNYFHAERQDGRLLLTFINSPSSQDATSNEEKEEEAEEYEQVFDNTEELEGNKAKFDDCYEEEEEEEEEELGDQDEEFEFEKENGTGEMEYVMTQNSKLSSGRVINVQKSALMMKKLMGLHNKNLTWAAPHKFNKAVKLVGVEEEVVVVENELATLPQSLPSPPRVARLFSTPAPATAASYFNAYEYFWRRKPSMASIIKPIPEESTTLKYNNNKVVLASSLKRYEQQNLVLVRGNKADDLVPSLRRCNETTRTLLLWEPHCIATS